MTISQPLDYMKQKDHAGYTPLLTAVFYKSEKCVEYILKNIVSVDIVNPRKYYLAVNDDKENILHICAKRQIKEDLFNIIWDKLSRPYEHCNELLDMIDMRDAKPLQVAAHFNNEYMCGKVLDHFQKGIKDVDILLLKSEAARESCLQGNLEILKLIIGFDSGKKLEQKSSDHIKIKSEQKSSNHIRIKSEQKSSNQIKSKSEQLVPDQIKILESKDKNSYTCLHLAASQGNIVH